MAIPQRTVVTATGPSGASTFVPLNTRSATFQVSLVVAPGSGALPSVQYTLDDIWASGYSAGSGTWIPHPEMSSISGSLSGNLGFPASAVRLVNSSGAGAGVNSTLTVLQKGDVR